MRRSKPELSRKRVKVAVAVSITGLEARTVRDMALAGQIPGAAKLRGCWTFDLVKLEQFNRDAEATVCQNAKRLRVVSGATGSSTGVFRPAAATSNGHYGQTIQRLREVAARRNEPER